ncbi:hypothetical protein [Nonomuraea sp. NPDC023979]|uniref:hypothetical protein n=1 Tax=Nonomuraea sp. NPDC023979 TaxID=3154796 RepID=UPI0033DD0570
MLIAEARRVAGEWARDEGARLPGFAGAFLTGSALWAEPGDDLPTGSDVDVMVALDPVPDAVPLAGGGKFRHQGVLLEVSYLPADAVADAETVLADYHLAGAFHRPGVLADPAGRLTALQREVSRRFAERRWVLARTGHALDRVRAFLADVVTPGRPGMTEEAHVTAWLFGTGVTAHVLLVAGLRNPTIRRRYEAAGELLAARGLPECHEHLLDLLGSAALTPARARRHLAAVERAFDHAAPVHAPAYRFSSDISRPGRPVAVDGSRDLLDRGLHREAAFWLVATYARCLAKLASAGRRPPAALLDDFHALLADLGADTPHTRRDRATRVLAALPTLTRIAHTLAPP